MTTSPRWSRRSGRCTCGRRACVVVGVLVGVGLCVLVAVLVGVGLCVLVGVLVGVGLCVLVGVLSTPASFDPTMEKTAELRAIVRPEEFLK
jgi:hypothetical protein